jgi:hypothetical protein
MLQTLKADTYMLAGLSLGRRKTLSCQSLASWQPLVRHSQTGFYANLQQQNSCGICCVMRLRHRQYKTGWHAQCISPCRLSCCQC